MDRSDHMTDYILFLLFFGVVIHVAGVKLSMSAQRVLPEPGTVTLTCLVDETDVDSVFVMQIGLYIGEMLTRLGLLRVAKNITATIPTGYADRMTVSGSFDQTATNSKIMLTIDQEKIQCNDGTVYQCELTYLTNDVPNPKSVTTIQNGTLEVYEYPSVMSLEGRLNGLVVKGPTAINKAQFQVGDQLELTCSANVGSIPSTVIQWRRTSEIGSVDNFIKYNPPFGTVSETDPVKDACAYTRTATIRYNMTMADVNRQSNLGFECYVRLTTPPYNNYETTDNKQFYAEVGASTATYGKEEKEVSSSNSLIGGVTGGVAGAIFIAAIVLIIVYLKRQGFNRKDNKEPEDMTESSPQYESLEGLPQRNQEADYSSLSEDKKELEDMSGRSPQYESLKGRPKGNQVAEYSSLSEAVQPEESPANYYNSPDRKPYQNLQTSQT